AGGSTDAESTYEDGEPDTPSEVTPTTSAADVAHASDGTLEPDVAARPREADQVADAEEPAAAPRVRRRRTTRRTATTEAEDAPGAAETAEQPLMSAQTPVPEQSADILPAPPPEAASANGPAIGESDDAAPKRTGRPRRVA